MILSYQTIKALRMVSPMEERTVHESGMTFGLGPCGYDIRVDQSFSIPPGGFVLVSSHERFDMPWDVMAQVADKSSWARRGIVVQNTKIEPGWRGYLTLEITSHNPNVTFDIEAGTPIADITFMRLDVPTMQPYNGKYQDQERRPVGAIEEVGS